MRDVRYTKDRHRYTSWQGGINHFSSQTVDLQKISKGAHNRSVGAHNRSAGGHKTNQHGGTQQVSSRTHNRSSGGTQQASSRAHNRSAVGHKTGQQGTHKRSEGTQQFRGWHNRSAGD